MIPPLQLNRSEFKTWLKLNPHLRFERMSVCNCPLAKFLQHRDPGGAWTVGKYGAHLTEEGELQYFSLPSWAQQFVECYDRPFSGRPLEILDSIES